MRLRKIKGADAAVLESPFCIPPSEQLKGAWRTAFACDGPIHIEIGMGKGRFLMTLAARNPQISYIGIERYESVLYRALQKMEQTPLPNVRFLCMDALLLSDVFAGGEVDRIYLNFSDPWPKARHAKRRLTSRQFLRRYEQILSPGGTVEFKTDDRELFGFSLQEIRESGWTLLSHTYDLHGEKDWERENVMTEYEEKFSAQGNPICKLVARP